MIVCDVERNLYLNHNYVLMAQVVYEMLACDTREYLLFLLSSLHIRHLLNMQQTTNYILVL